MHWHILPNDPATFQIPTRGLNPETGETDPESVGYDIYAPADGFLDALSRKLIPLGFRAEFANDHVGRYMDRSGMANKGIHMLGGVIDPSYRDEWKLILFNTNGETFRWKRGDRIIQVVFMPIRKPVPQIVASLSPSPRTGGLGSTGQ
jgi:deoxyuridine 5'-triphosphate nucleotidohydrolase